MKSLERLIAEIIIERYIECDHIKCKAAESLGMSERGFRMRFLRIRIDYPDLFETIGAKPVDKYACACFPTNEERLAYKDCKRVTRN